MENRAHALAAGIFTILLGIAAAIAIWWLGQSDESTTRYVLETRRNVTGLNVQAQVRYRGIRAGKVQAIEPDDGDPRVILVTIDMDSRFKLTRGSHRRTRLSGCDRSRLCADRGRRFLGGAARRQEWRAGAHRAQADAVRHAR
jgi:phospholipid/cholesterol/gamma-HCH transport system substrate-binding protein